MELTPEERQRIYLEEKARLEAREQLLQEATQKPKKSSRLFLWILGMICFPILFAKLIASPTQTKLSAKTPAQLEAEAKAVQNSYNACNAKLQKAKELEMLYDIGGHGARIQVFVGPTYFTVPIDAKKGFVEVVNCVMVKGTGGGVPFELIHWQTGKRVANWNGYRLDIE